MKGSTGRAGAVDENPAAENIAPGCGELPSGSGSGGNGIDFLIKMEANAVEGGIVRHGIGQFIGADDGAFRHIQGADDLRIQGGLGSECFLPVEQAEIFDAVGDAAPQQLLQGLPVLIIKADDQGAALPVRHGELRAQGREHRRAEDVILCLCGAGLCIVAGVDNAAVGFGGALGNILPALENDNRNVITAQFPGKGNTGDPRPCDHDIRLKHFFRLLRHKRNLRFIWYNIP